MNYIIKKDDCEFKYVKFVIKALDAKSQSEICHYLFVVDGVFYGTDGHRLHYFKPQKHFKDGVYSVVSNDKNAIFLESLEKSVTLPLEGIINLKTIKSYSVSLGRVEFTELVYWIYTELHQCLNIRYLSDFMQDDKCKISVLECPEQLALIKFDFECDNANYFGGIVMPRITDYIDCHFKKVAVEKAA